MYVERAHPEVTQLAWKMLMNLGNVSYGHQLVFYGVPAVYMPLENIGLCRMDCLFLRVSRISVWILILTCFVLLNLK